MTNNLYISVAERRTVRSLHSRENN